MRPCSVARRAVVVGATGVLVVATIHDAMAPHRWPPTPHDEPAIHSILSPVPPPFAVGSNSVGVSHG